MPVIGDSLILADKEDADEPEIAKVLDWSRREEIFTDKRYVMGYCIVPPIVPDSLRPLTISSEALESIVTYVNDISKKIDNESSTKDSL